MSRGPSPSPVSVLSPITHSASSVSLRSPNLRINLDSSNHLNHRSRSNTTLSPPPQNEYIHPRSLSLSHQISPTEAKDVVLAVRNLRGEESPARSSSNLRELVLDEEEDEGEQDESMLMEYETPGKSRDRDRRRERSQTPARAGVSTMQRIMRALEKSPDEGDTLDLSRKGIDDIGDEEVEMFKSGVGKDLKGVWRSVPSIWCGTWLMDRLALSYNALDDGAIVKSFSTLTRLRYLNLKGNLLTQFPEAVSLLSLVRSTADK